MKDTEPLIFRKGKRPWYDRARVLVAILVLLGILLHFAVTGLLTALELDPKFRAFAWFPAFLGALCVILIARLVLHLYRNHLPKSIED